MRRTRLGKKGEGELFMGLLVIVVLIIFTTLYLDLRAKTGTFEEKIGEKQFAVIAAAQQGEAALVYIDLAAQYAYFDALRTLGKNHYVDPTACGQYRGSPIVYGTKDCMSYGDSLPLSLHSAFADAFNEALDPYLEAYEPLALPMHNYLFRFEEGTIYGVSQFPLEIPIFSITSTPIQDTSYYGAAKQFSTWPVVYSENYVTSCFGYRGGDIAKGKGSVHHPGIDIRAPTGTEIVSIDAGTVTAVDPYRWGRVAVDHGAGIHSEYVHLDTVSVAVGQAVEPGDVLGTGGGRGPGGANAYSPHLHFSIVDTNIAPSLKDAEGNAAVLSSFGQSGYVNSLCYMDPMLGFEIADNLGCRSQGGAKKFCGLYMQGIDLSGASSKEILQHIDTTYGTQIAAATAGTRVTKPLLIGLIAQESAGNPNVVSATGCVGLLQFCARTASEYGLCVDPTCTFNDKRADPTAAIPAGVALLNDNIAQFSRYDQRVAFALAAYNGGPKVVQAAIDATGSSNPTWEQVAAALDPSMITYFKTTEQRVQKVKEIREYVPRVLGYTQTYETMEKE